MKSLITTFVIAGFIIAGCSGSEETKFTEPVNLSLTSLDKKLYADFDKAPGELIEIYGNPEKIDTNKVTNRHTGFEDNTYTLFYDNLEVKIYHAIESKKYLLLYVLLESDKLLSKYGLAEGLPKNKLKITNGNKRDELEKSDQSELTYSSDTSTGYESYFTFHFEDNRLTKLGYSAPVD